MTKEIRLLTGRHAGARIKLNPTLTHIGNDDEADIQISDWTMPTMQLSHHEDGHVSISDPTGAHPDVTLEDFVPHRFGDIVLCAGDADAAWPSDIALLETALAPVATPVATSIEVPAPQPQHAPRPLTDAPRRGHAMRNAGFAGVAVLAIGCAGIALPAVLRPREAATALKALQEPDAAMLATGLRQLDLHDLEVKRQDGRFLVMGVVPDSASEMAARRIAENIAPGRVVWRVGCVDQITRDLQESLHDSSLHVRYLGNRTFEVTGVAKNANAVRTTLEQLTGDLAPMVKQIAARFGTDDRMAPPTDVESLLAVDGLQYMVSSDGTKHFVDTQTQRDTLN
ncbi:HrpD5 family protein [Trinickia caryophylli]|uniref:Type III secretion protein D n=1 Tax=Trinickia caryophylli TaxID=28094 RepID=A0A1X7D6J2_TRICW|nr:HrpD5 family protein [Trinickia caryophylli]TRX15084.1 hypothetical protein FNF07_28210 [Trinickia caryophylli]WQE14943.1 HrpD5 family protein [Trinickia caryophylli]GLU31328.1 type III secretion protein [Trinickia caryophylli]SMF09794.1 type III secretion protein D [Trinickia caryophylli]